MKAPISLADKSKMEAARTLIQEKRYAEARSLLQGVNHPTAHAWLRRLDELQPKRKSRVGWIIAGGTVSVLLAAIALAIVLIVSREVARTSAAATVTAANATLAYIDQQVEIHLSATLQTYCTSVSGRAQGQCRRWADGVLQSRTAEAAMCDSEYDWIYDRNSFSLCLLSQGIAVLGEQTFIDPIANVVVPTADIQRIAQDRVICEDRNPEDYCYVWAWMRYGGHFR